MLFPSMETIADVAMCGRLTAVFISLKIITWLKLKFNIVTRDLPGGKRILIINIRAQHIIFTKAIKAYY